MWRQSRAPSIAPIKALITRNVNIMLINCIFKPALFPLSLVLNTLSFHREWTCFLIILSELPSVSEFTANISQVFGFYKLYHSL